MKLSKSRKFFLFSFISICIVSLVLFLPAVRMCLINLAEYYLGRSINAVHWNKKIIIDEIYFLAFSLIFISPLFPPPLQKYSNIFCTERIFYCDLLRVIAVILIILVHVSAQKWYTTDVTSINWKIMHAYDNIGAIGNCIFVMISGTLFLDKKKKITSKYLRKKIFHLVVVYIFWQTAYFLSTNSLKLSMQFLKDIFFNLFDHYSHLWFLFMIAGIYFCVPIFPRNFLLSPSFVIFKDKPKSLIIGLNLSSKRIFPNFISK